MIQPKPTKRAKKPRKPIRRYKRPAYLRVRGGRGKLRQLADDAMSLYVRWRDGWSCQKCGAQVMIQCAHIVPKSGEGQAGRYSETNAMALCGKCHTYYTSHPYEWRLWVGAERFDGLHSLYSGKLVKWDLAEEARRFLLLTAKHYPEAQERLSELNAQANRLELWK
jgi:5-methylcytosine-specific restriction endonuclease McrA